MKIYSKGSHKWFWKRSLDMFHVTWLTCHTDVYVWPEFVDLIFDRMCSDAVFNDTQHSKHTDGACETRLRILSRIDWSQNSETASEHLRCNIQVSCMTFLLHHHGCTANQMTTWCATMRSRENKMWLSWKWEKGFLQRSASFEWSGMPVPRTMVLVSCRLTDAVGHEEDTRSRYCFRYVVSQRSAGSQCWLTF